MCALERSHRRRGKDRVIATGSLEWLECAFRNLEGKDPVVHGWREGLRHRRSAVRLTGTRGQSVGCPVGVGVGGWVVMQSKPSLHHADAGPPSRQHIPAGEAPVGRSLVWAVGISGDPHANITGEDEGRVACFLSFRTVDSYFFLLFARLQAGCAVWWGWQK